jgi:pimeloyl-ACP methyl ester carboxylesterase
LDSAAPTIAYRGGDTAVGFRDFHPDPSLNFQCNRWLQWIGPEAAPEIAAVAAASSDYPQWIDGFLGLAERVRGEGRAVAAAYYDRAAEFFMVPDDPRRAPARERFLAAMRAAYGFEPDAVAYAGTTLPAYDLRPPSAAAGTIVAFGGFDSYVEEFFPLFSEFAANGYRVIAFDGPGQGGALEDSGLPMTAEWERPVAAVLDHYGLERVIAVGISLGGGLVVRAAAFEPRISRVVALDILDDELEAVARQIGPGVTVPMRLLLALRARRPLNAIARLAAARKPVSDWGLRQGMHVTGTATPYDFLQTTRATNTRSISDRVTADVLLLAGSDDHYVPLSQLHRQAAGLVNARSVTTRVFTAAEHASNHCQVGNIGLCARVIEAWLRSSDVDDAAVGSGSGVARSLSRR